MKKEWVQLEEYVLEHIKELDTYAKRSPGSGNKGRKGDITTSLPIHIECKQRDLKSCYRQEWYDKTQEEIPLHVKKIAVLITEDNNNNKMAHISFEDFWELFKRTQNETI